MGEGLLTVAEMTQTSISLGPPHSTQHTAQVTAHKAGNHEYTAQPAGSSVDWRVLFPGACTGLNLFWVWLVFCFFQSAFCQVFAAWLSESSSQPDFLLSEGHSQLLLLTLAGKALGNLSD